MVLMLLTIELEEILHAETRDESIFGSSNIQ